MLYEVQFPNLVSDNDIAFLFHRRTKCFFYERTGESVPVMKVPVPNPLLSGVRADGDESVIFNIKEHSRHTLFCGTQVLQTRYYSNQRVRAVVIRTGALIVNNSLK